MTDTHTYEKCSCGARQKSKCVKESGLGSGKMCLKPLFDMPENYVFKRMETFDPNDWAKEWEKDNEPNN